MKPTSIAIAASLACLLASRAVTAQSSHAGTIVGAELAEADPLRPTNTPEADPAIVSNVRIVRLSLARGVVQMDRNTGRGSEPAFANMPIVKGAKLRTGEGVAEVEFEDNSSLRLIPHSMVRFDQLGRTLTGATVTDVSVLEGTAYVSLAKTKENVFNVMDGESKLALDPGTSVRFAAGKPEASLAVFRGEVQVERPGSVTALLKKQTLLFDPAGGATPVLVQRTEPEAYDDWDRSQQDYHRGAATFAGAGGAGLYGASDLSYYGQFSNLGGCGNAWRPYFASAAWDPFANGTWALYPGAGYSWVSPYPWGWLPFHSGSWQYCGANGWGWQPNGQWYGLQNLTAMNGIAERTSHPKLPVPPGLTNASLIPVNTKPLVVSGLSSEGNFTFRRDSAGIGVPRETFGKLHSLSSAAERGGSVSTAAASAPVATASSNGFTSPGLSRSASQPGSSVGSSLPSSSRASMGSGPAMSSSPAAGASGGGGGAHK